MASRGERDHSFPATSIGRTQGSRIQRVPSNDSLPTHPLLSTSRPSSPSPEHTTNPQPNPRYVPYTPRQRVSPTAATTGTNMHPSSPQHQQGDATTKLQLVNLKAAAQNIGLDSASLGWAMLERLTEHDHHDTQWMEVWAPITFGKATLLLPLEPLSTHDKLTPEFFKDHIVLCDGPSRRSAPIITLSGIRGTLNGDTLTFRSTIHSSSKAFQDLLSPSTRTSALNSLPDLPLISSSNLSNLYPAFILPSYSPALPIPPRTHSNLPGKPPLPLRPGNRAAASASSTASRISNPFASLFGGGGGGSGSNLHHSKTATPAPPSPTASVRSLDSTPTQTESVIDVCAFTIERKITQKDLAKEMNKAVRREATDLLSLDDGALPPWVVDRVHALTAGWYPFVKEKDIASSVPGPRTREKAMKEGGNTYVVAWAEEAPEKTTARMQDFYMALEQDLRLLEGSFSSRLNERRNEGKEDNEGTEDEKRVREKIDREAKIKKVMGVVEQTICSLFYDRLYMQPTSDDSSHDEALSSRVAALNMLDLGLEHLDLKVDHASDELDVVVRACGETLSQLQVCHSPGDKAALLVSAHKIVVDGLSRLPPIRLMSEEESKTQKAKGSSIPGDKADAPPRESDGSLRILMPLPPTASNTTATDPLGTAETSTSLLFEAPPETASDLDSATPGKPSHHHPTIPTIIEPESTPDSEDGYSYSPGATFSLVPIAQPHSARPTPVSGDVLLPMIIFSVVKANPPHLVSSLLYTQRYRNHSVGGEENYCLVNLLAVAEFLENVDLAALGLNDSNKVLSAADLTPIPLNRSPIINTTPLATGDGHPGSLRDRVEQANKVITGVVDSSFGMLRSLLPITAPVAPLTPPADGVQSAAPWNAAKPGFGLLRRETGFSIRSITAALPINRGAPRVTSGEELGQQLVTVSRPGSVKSTHGDVEESDVEESGTETGTEDEDLEDKPVNGDANVGDTRSIRSFESMMGERGKRDPSGHGTRKTLTDRLANMSNFAGLKNNSHVQSATQPHQDTLSGSQSPDPDSLLLHLAPPIQRFVDCTPGDLRLSEVGELLRDYRRLVEAIRVVKGFDE